MKQTYLKLIVAFIIFGVSFLGFTMVKKVKRIGNQSLVVNAIALSSQAQAYCNEATYLGETNNGHCSGAFNDIQSRCQTNTSGDCDCTNTQPGS